MITPKKLPQRVVEILIQRLSDEFEAMYFYREASNWCANAGFFKAAEYFAKESNDESDHAKGIENFLVQWNVSPLLPIIDRPDKNTSLVQILEDAYKIEFSLYEAYEEDSKKIFEIGDICTFDFLKFYREAQTKSVAEYSDKINMLTGVDTDKMNLLLLEKKLFKE